VQEGLPGSRKSYDKDAARIRAPKSKTFSRSSKNQRLPPNSSFASLSPATSSNHHFSLPNCEESLIEETSERECLIHARARLPEHHPENKSNEKSREKDGNQDARQELTNRLLLRPRCSLCKRYVIHPKVLQRFRDAGFRFFL